MAESHDHAKAAHGDAHGAEGGGHGGHKKKHHHHGHAHHEEHEEGWIVSFADNVLLMMGFFVILLAMNMGPKATGPESEGDPGSSAAAQGPSDHMLDFAIAVREAFHNPVRLDSTRPEDQALIRRLRERASMGETNRPGPEGDRKSVQSVRPSDWSGRAGYVEFADHASDLTSAARTILAEMAREIAGTRWMVEVRGHASRLEGWGDVRKARRLSYDRAWAVGHELTLHGVRWEQIRLVASGDHAPVTPRARTASEHHSNQRAEVLIMPETLPPDPYTESGTPR